jgi:hypothetical protein
MEATARAILFALLITFFAILFATLALVAALEAALEAALARALALALAEALALRFCWCVFEKINIWVFLSCIKYYNYFVIIYHQFLSYHIM